MDHQSLDAGSIKWSKQDIHRARVEASSDLLVLQSHRTPAPWFTSRAGRVAGRIRTSGAQHGDQNDETRTILHLNIGGYTRKKRQAERVIQM